jgi:hypothetical protein
VTAQNWCTRAERRQPQQLTLRELA